VTSRATFGDFMRAAGRHLERPAGPAVAVAKRRLPAARAKEIAEASDALLRVVTVMTRYTADIGAAFAEVEAHNRHRLNPWARACAEVHDALGNAAAFLRPEGAGRHESHRVPPDSPLAHRLDAVAESLAAGRDLLHTHFAPGPGAARLDHSDWSPVITSVPVTRALLAEIGSLARRIAPEGTELALSRAPLQRGAGEARRRLNAACQWLWVTDAAVQAGQCYDPVAADARRLLHAVPVNICPPRRLPRAGESVTALANGIIDGAERLRHSSRLPAAHAAWSPAMTSESSRQTATAGMLTSHHCQILLRSLAACAAPPGSADATARLLESADAAGRARADWLAAAHAWDNITTDTRGYISQAASDAHDLALWTGRLAYADPAWTPVSGPSCPVRPSEDLAARPGDIPLVVAAIHHACESLTRLAHGSHDQIQTASQAGRLLVPTRSLPESVDIPRPFGPAPRERTASLLAVHREAGTASAHATGKIGEVAADVGAPSQILAAARAATHPGSEPTARNSATPAPETPDVDRHWPGPVERILRDLGTSDPVLLRRGAAIDRAGEQLIIDAAETVPARHSQRAAHLSRSPDTAGLINRVLASRDPCAVPLLRPPTRPQAAQAEAEP